MYSRLRFPKSVLATRRGHDLISWAQDLRHKAQGILQIQEKNLWVYYIAPYALRH